MDRKAKIASVASVLAIGLLLLSIVAAPPPVKECRDGMDNDGDGATDWPADAGCANKNDNDETNCGDGVCEGGETQASCSADCTPPDSCSDSDGGFIVTVQGTVSGDSGGSPYSFTDSCNGAIELREWTCSGTSPVVGGFNCTGNFTGCSNGACV